MTLQLPHDVMEVAAGQRHRDITHSTSQLICYTLKKNNEGKQQMRLARAAGQVEITSSDSVASAFSFPEVGVGQVKSLLREPSATSIPQTLWLSQVVTPRER